MSSSIPERTVESWLAVELEVWFPSVRLWAPTQSAAGNWDLATQGAGKLLIFECKGCDPLKAGHSVPINMPQLERYAIGPEFENVREHLFYVLPAPPWKGPAPSPPAPFRPAAALPAAHADHRLGGVAGGCWEWFHVTTAVTLWASLTATQSASVNTRRLPNPPSLGLAPHSLGPLPGTERLGDFLEEVAYCRGVPLTGGKGEGLSPQTEEADEWRRPDGRHPEGPAIWPGEGVPPDPPRPPDNARQISDQLSDGSAPTPLAAFLPLDSLAV
jgi:hypothetical protein